MEIPKVFTPRNAEVNLAMYIPRLELERSLLRSVQGSMHSILFGDSGNGKSWLYKKVLDQNRISYAIANCGNASRRMSLTEEIASTIGVESADSSAEGVQDPLLAAFRCFRRKANDQHAVLVLDNLESIFENRKLMDELADIIILLDDGRYAVNNIKLLIVGVPNGVLDYFAKTKNLSSVTNRLEEVRKVDGLSGPMVHTFVETGFNGLLRLGIHPNYVAEIGKHIHHVTMGVAQRVHEYCERLAYIIDDAGGRFRIEMLGTADREWLRLGMRQAYTVIESHLNSKRTSIARRNQIIYSIGRIRSHQFDSSTILDRLREDFPNTISEHNMGIGTILGDLAKGDSPLLQKNPSTNEFRVVDPRYIMCIRIALQIDPNSKTVNKLLFAS